MEARHYPRYYTNIFAKTYNHLKDYEKAHFIESFGMLLDVALSIAYMQCL